MQGVDLLKLINYLLKLKTQITIPGLKFWEALFKVLAALLKFHKETQKYDVHYSLNSLGKL